MITIKKILRKKINNSLSIENERLSNALKEAIEIINSFDLEWSGDIVKRAHCIERMKNETHINN